MAPVDENARAAKSADIPWYVGVGAAGWEPLARAFIRRELPKPDPDYMSLAIRLAGSCAEERHAAWIRVAQEAPTRLGRTRAYIEALHNDPDLTSVAWSWLSGDMDLMGRVEHVIGPRDARTLSTVDTVRGRLGSILELGGGDLDEGTDSVAEPEPAAAAQPEPKGAAEPEPKPAAEPESKPAAAARPKPAAAARPKPAAAAAAEPEPVAAAEPEPVAAAEPEPAPVAPDPQPAAAVAQPTQPAASTPASGPGPSPQPAAQWPAAQLPEAQLPAAQPPATPPLASIAWSPTHFVPAGGLQAWDYPDPTRPPQAALSAGLGVVIDAVAGDWAFVRAVNGWRGWVDGRRLVGRA
jgi:hypothetical protein